MTPPRPPTTTCRRCRTGRPRPTICRRRSARSRQRCGPGSRPPAAPSRRSSPSSRSASPSGSPRSRRRRSAARRCGRSSTTPTSPPAPSPPSSWPSSHRRGCLVVRGHFDREQASAWDQDIVDYVERNRFFENYRGPGDDFFGSVGSKPEIYPIYWSPAQMEARQSDRMATRAGVPQPPVEARVRRRAVVRPRPRLALPRPHPPPARRAPTPAAWAPTSTPAPSTCG